MIDGNVYRVEAKVAPSDQMIEDGAYLGEPFKLDIHAGLQRIMAVQLIDEAGRVGAVDLSLWSDPAMRDGELVGLVELPFPHDMNGPRIARCDWDQGWPLLVPETLYGQLITRSHHIGHNITVSIYYEPAG